MGLCRNLRILLTLGLCALAGAAEAAPRVAVLAASASTGPDVQAKLLATNGFAAVDLINVAASTPSVQALQAYDAVLVYSNAAFASASTLGDNLATYLEAGGGVVLLDWEAQEQSFAALGGRYQATYTLMTPQAAQQIAVAASNLGQIVEKNSSIMAGITTFGCLKNPCHRLTSAVKNGGVVVAKWADNNPLVIRGSINGHSVVEINAFAASTSVMGGEWDPNTDGGALLRNALLYVIPGPLKAARPNLVFGGTPVGQAASQLITYTNTGNAPLTVTGLTVGGANAAEYTVVPSAVLPRQIPPGGTLDAMVTFTPGGQGAGRTAVVAAAVMNSLAAVDTSITGTGLAPALGISPASVNFGGIAVGKTINKSFTLTNNTANSISVTAVAVTLDNAEFTCTPSFGLPVTLPAGASFDFATTFTPGSSGNHFGTATITANGQPGTTVPLVGSSGDAAVLLGNNGVIFANTHVGSVSAPQSLTVGNNGYGDLKVINIALAGQNAGDFGLMVPMLPVSIGPGATFTYQLLFRPMALGNRAASVIVTSDDPNAGSITFAIGGAGVAYGETVAPGMVDFGGVKTGATSGVKPVALNNTSKAPMTVKKVLITGAQAASFSLINPPPDNSVINSGGTLSASVVFKPARASLSNATLTFLLDDPNMPTATVSLTGQGTAGAIGVMPLAIDFGGVPVGKSSAAKPITLSNGGSDTLTITDLQFTGPDASRFDSPDKPNLPVTIGAGKSISFDLVFSPILHSMSSAQMVIVSDDPSSPTVPVQLTAAGTQAKFSVSPLNIDFGVLPLGVASGRVPITIGNSGDNSLGIDSIQLAGGNASAFHLDVPATPTTIKAGDSLTVNVSFVPSVAMTANAQVVVTPTDMTLVPASVALKGTGLSAALAIDQMTIDFGIVEIGKSSSPTTVKVKNIAGASITLSPITSANPLFTVDTSMTMLTLAPSATTTFAVIFTPTATDMAMGKIDLALSTAPGKALGTVELVGQGSPPKFIGSNNNKSVGSCAVGHGHGRPAPLAPLLLVGALVAWRRRSRRQPPALG